MTPISDHEKQLLLSQILESPEFHESKRYQELLQYLIEKSSSGSSLKEYEIARDLFGKGTDFDPSTDPLIRSYISNLRKKLEHYYLTTENQFAHKLEIPKGQYLVTYVTATNRDRAKQRFLRSPYLYLAIIALLASFIAFREFSRQAVPLSNPPAVPVNFIWTEFLQDDSPPILLILGDYLFLSEKGKRYGRTFLREPRINSDEELRAYAQVDPEKYGAYEVSDVSYVGAAASLGIPALLHALGDSCNRISIKLSSQLKWDDLENHSVVFVGSFKTLYRLDTLFSRTNIRYRLSPNTLEIRDSNQGIVKTYTLDWRGGSYQRDYSVILKLSGPKNNPMVFLTGFSEVGIMDAVRNSTDPALMSRINSFQAATLQSPFLFEMVSEAEGVKYTVFRTQIQHFEVLERSRTSAE
ncbi:MAG: Tetratricopeptide 2 repeat protein [Bacteroidetes bacterium]|jgi:hypothetical protein|nr:Tetratricopeptide 2 repeat protein [Bacteroidota bacterium]